MSRYWHRRKYRKENPEDLIILLIGIPILSIFYPPIRSVVLSFWYIYAFAFIILLILISYKLYSLYKISKAGIREIDKMSGTDFELYLVNLFKKLGYKAQHTGRIGDLGSDLVVEINGLKTAVQAKRYENHVGPDAVREALAVIKPRNCSFGMVVTNSYFTQEAKYLAKSNNITLWDRNTLINNIIKSKKTNTEISQFFSS